MKKFSEFKPIRRIYEQEITLQNKNEEETDTESTQQTDSQQIVVTANVQSSPQSAQPQETQTTEEEKVETTKIEPVKLFSKLFESREMAHVYHLSVKGDPGSHAAHIALNEYYEGVLELIDMILEVYQGQYGIVEDYETIDTSGVKSKEKISYFEELAKFIKEGRKCINIEDTHLHNIIDEIVGLVYRTLYKLKYTR